MPALSAVDEKVPIGREDLGVVGEFGHSDEARVGDTHRLVGVLAQKAKHIRQRWCRSLPFR